MEFFRVETATDANELIRTCPEVVAIDTEYVKGDPRTTTLLSLIIADDTRAWICNPSLLNMMTPMIRARKLVFLQDYNHCDTIILYHNGCDLRDTLCYNLIDMHHLINENKDHGLESRVFEAYGDNYKTRLKGQYEDLEYQGKDGCYTYQLGMKDLGELQILGKFDLYHSHVRRTSLALLDTELTGVCVDTVLITKTKNEMEIQINEYLPKLKGEFNDYCNLWELQKWEKKCAKFKTFEGRSRVHRPAFSFNSDKQISWLLYEGLGLPVLQRTPVKIDRSTGKKSGGNPSTRYEALEELNRLYPRIQMLLEFKQYASVYDTFVKGMLERVDNDRIYPHFNVSGTDTGRISHSNPNMGNLPTDGIIRHFFIPSKGMVIIGADYAQLEVVIEANLTRDSSLVKIITEGVSKHDITAEGLGVDRNTAKTLNFALQYGAGAFKVKQLLGISLEEAEGIFQRYWELYSGVSALKEETIQILKEKGQVTNLFGRTRHFDPPKNKGDWGYQCRAAYNFLIQGVAGDACNRAYWKFHEYLRTSGRGRTLWSVHDEIVAEVLPEYAEECKQELKNIMEEVSKYLKFNYRLVSSTYGPLFFWQKT